MKNIYLVGFMGTGKTSAGKELARRKKWQFADLDELIELKERRPISDIFAKDKEPYFRKVEHETLKEVSREQKFVVACGGGVVINPYNIKLMHDTGIIICLTARPQVILKRTQCQSHRPLLNVANPARQIELLMKLRAPYYSRADKVIDTSDLSMTQVVDAIIKALKKNKK